MKKKIIEEVCATPTCSYTEEEVRGQLNIEGLLVHTFWSKN
jgi:hypothetical protein